MDFGLALMQMYPSINKTQFELIAHPDGMVEITRWDPIDIAQPTEQQVVDYWNSSIGSLNYFKQRKKNILSQQCNGTITSGFPSSALGTSHTYPSDDEDQRNFHSEIDRLNLDTSYTTIYFKTLDAGYLAHTVDQFKQVFIDGHTYGRQQIAKLNDLKSQVDLASSEAELDAITW